MKRREFLQTTVGIAGSIVPLAAAEARPCPPSPLSVNGGAAVTTACTAASSTADWLARSTAPGVIWAHDFVNDNELNYFIRSENPSDANGIVTNPTPGVLPNGLTLGSTPFGNSRAIVSRAVGTTLTAAVPAANSYPAHDTQVWSVANAANIPSPNGQPYRLLVGNGTDSGGVEWIELQSVNVANNTITVRRKMTSNR
jgi:hypothetical protein